MRSIETRIQRLIVFEAPLRLMVLMLLIKWLLLFAIGICCVGCRTEMNESLIDDFDIDPLPAIAGEQAAITTECRSADADPEAEELWITVSAGHFDNGTRRLEGAELDCEDGAFDTTFSWYAPNEPGLVVLTMHSSFADGEDWEVLLIPVIAE